MRKGEAERERGQRRDEKEATVRHLQLAKIFRPPPIPPEYTGELLILLRYRNLDYSCFLQDLSGRGKKEKKRKEKEEGEKKRNRRRRNDTFAWVRVSMMFQLPATASALTISRLCLPVTVPVSRVEGARCLKGGTKSKVRIHQGEKKAKENAQAGMKSGGKVEGKVVGRRRGERREGKEKSWRDRALRSGEL